MARLEDAVREAEGGVALNLEVHPGAKAAGFPSGFNPWRGRVQARVRAPPEDGEANAEMVGLLAEFFRLAPAQVALAQGATNRQKTVVLRGLAWREVIARLREGLEAQQ